ncbi:hypothetical protein SCHPADRAFT_996154 [Schizopora paradoxa]|uniref:Uncharacterized protein n=1 Tax=Schizopora paradoxa TaxID=27342 RepID=A0A0H2RTX8_9AGAM|nr:hypothetical protein SCHPADRAFT_996154 [Schizopora paradoxa]
MAPKFKQKKYTNKPEEHFIVVLNPWGMPNVNRIDRDVDAFGVWLRYMFSSLGQPSCNVEAVYIMNTRTEVIVRMSSTTDIVPALGEHKWSKFLKPSFLEAPSTREALMAWINVLSGNFLFYARSSELRNESVSHIFEYNWERNGDPAIHQWAEHYPTTEEPPERMNFPVRRDYPKPSWAAPPLGLASLTRILLLPLPSSRTKTPPPEEIKEEDQPFEPQNLEVKGKVEPQVLDATAEQSAASSRLMKEEQTEDIKPFQKQDPYEEESAAQQSLFSVKEEPQEACGNLAVKKEESDTCQNPDDELLQMIARQRQDMEREREQRQRSLARPDSPNRRNYTPSSAIIVKEEPGINLPRSRDPRKRPQASDFFDPNKRIKRET